MFTHFVIIISCFSMIGVTALPAALINCCCKSEDRVCSMAKASPRSCSAGMNCSMPVPEPKPCCSQKHINSVSQYSLKKDCPNCRCLEHLQTVSLSGQNTINESTIRFSAYTAALSDVPPVFAHESASFETALLSDARGTPVNLQTCTLRC